MFTFLKKPGKPISLNDLFHWEKKEGSLWVPTDGSEFTEEQKFEAVLDYQNYNYNHRLQLIPNNPRFFFPVRGMRHYPTRAESFLTSSIYLVESSNSVWGKKIDVVDGYNGKIGSVPRHLVNEIDTFFDITIRLDNIRVGDQPHSLFIRIS